MSAVFTVATGEPEALRAIARASLAYRKRTQPLDVPSAGCIFQNPDPARDRVPDGIPCVGRRARRSRRPQGRAGRRRAGVAAARQLHRPRRRRHGARDPRAGRALPAAAWPSASASRLREEIVYLGEFDCDPASGSAPRTSPCPRSSSKAAAGCPAASPSTATRTRRCRWSRPACSATRPCRLENVPRISDIRVMAELLTGARRARSADSGRRRSRSRRRR